MSFLLDQNQYQILADVLHLNDCFGANIEGLSLLLGDQYCLVYYLRL